MPTHEFAELHTPTFDGVLCPPHDFTFGFDKVNGGDTVSGGCTTAMDWYVCAVAGSDTGSIPPCAVNSSQTVGFANFTISAATIAGGAQLTGTGNPLDLVIYYCASGDSLETRPVFPSVECVGP